MGRKKKISDMELAYLVGMGMNQREIAEKLDVNRSTVTASIARLRENAPELLALKGIEEFRKSESDDLAGMRQTILAALRRKLNTMSLSAISPAQLVTTYGVLFDKDRLLRGESTEHIATASYNQIDDKTRKVIADAVKQQTKNLMQQARKEIDVTPVEHKELT